MGETSQHARVIGTRSLAFTAAAATAALAGTEAQAGVDYTAGPISFSSASGGVGIDFDGNSGVANPGQDREAFIGVLVGDGTNDRIVLKTTEVDPDDAAANSLKVLVANGNLQPQVLAFGTAIGNSAPAGNSWADVNDAIFTGATIRDELGPSNFAINSSTEQYLGVQFAFATAPANIHYGWIGLSNLNPDAGTGTVTGYAYETTPGASIGAGVVPEPTGLALLAAGAAAAGLRRRPR